MTGFLLDTNVISELRRAKPDRKVVAFVERQALESLFVSIVTFAEIRFGIERLEDVDKRAELNDWLTNRIRPLFGLRLLPITEDVMLRWRQLVEDGRRVGHTFSQPDLIIAATALHYGLTIVSRDTRDYEKAHVPVFNPWAVCS